MIGRPLSHTQQSLGLGAVIQKGAIASGRCVKMGLGMASSKQGAALRAVMVSKAPLRLVSL